MRAYERNKPTYRHQVLAPNVNNRMQESPGFKTKSYEEDFPYPLWKQPTRYSQQAPPTNDFVRRSDFLEL